MSAVPSLDLSDHRTFADGFPHEHFRRLRDLDPVHWHEPTDVTPDGEGFWVVSRHADVSTVLRDPVTFSSDRGGVREQGGTAIKDERSAGIMLNMTDEPQHRRLRSLVATGFTPRTVGALEDELRRRTTSLLDAVEGADTFDIVAALSRELPLQTICASLGVPQEDRGRLVGWIERGLANETGSVMSPDATRRIREYAEELIARKRAEPTDDIFSTVVHARSDEDGSTLTDRELMNFFALLFPAGAETTRGAIGGAVLAFVEHPDQWERLRAERDELTRTAVEEVVRWTTPSVYKRRTASVDTELDGRRIARGDKVTIWEMSANRDGRVFDAPFRFDVGRRPNPHLGFGWGIHFCLGAALARLEIEVALDGLLGRYAGFELAGEPDWMPNNRLLGLRRLDVRARPLEGATT